MAALTHDLGKFTAWFQNKLRQSLQVRDPIRHEVVSFCVLKAAFEWFGTDNGWLEALSSKEHARAVLEMAFREANARPDYYLLGRHTHRLEAVLKSVKIPGSSLIHFRPEEKNAKFYLVSSLILTHHRLPEGKLGKKGGLLMTLGQMADDRSQSANGKYTLPQSLDQIFSVPEKLEPIWNDDSWLERVAEAASRLKTAAIQDFEADLKACSVYGRTAVILGDHRASQDRIQCGKAQKGFAYANTNDGLLADKLTSHLVRAADRTLQAFDLISKAQGDFPRLHDDEIPICIRQPDASVASPFAWQASANAATKEVADSNPAGSGFFGVLMAGTGSGKTRAAPIILAGVSRSLRINVCTGLRSLTLQGGLEYRRDMGFLEKDVSVVIGDKLTTELFELSVKEEPPTGADAEDFPEFVISHDADNGHALPKSTCDLFGSDASAVPLLSAPVLVSTLDILMPAADGTRGRHVVQSLRLGTADLIIDEIDDYGNEDIVAISRLVYIAAAYGRKVLISSATTTPEIAHALFTSYRKGWHLHCRSHGITSPIIAGWYSDLVEPKCQIIDSIEVFNAIHADFATDIVAKLKTSAPVRKAKVARLGTPRNPASLFDAISDEIKWMHGHNHVVDETTAKKVSVGVVRWNNVAPSMLHAKHLLESGLGKDHEVFVIPYNGTLTPAVRHNLEAAINPMLKRKRCGGTDPITINEHVRNALDVRSKTDNVIIVMITTSLEEVGRDHDFDWAVVEPGSLRGLVQIAGRVKRHRKDAAIHANVAIMEKCFREYQLTWGGKWMKTTPVLFAYPGFETPFEGLKESENYCGRFLLDRHDADHVYDIQTLSASIDAREVIASGRQSSPIGIKERERTKAFVQDGMGRELKLAVEDFIQDPMAMLSDYHPKHRRFRRSFGHDVRFYIVEDGNEAIWFRIEERGRKRFRLRCDKQVSRIKINEDRLLIKMQDEVTLARNLAAVLPNGAHDISRTQESLLTIQRPILDTSKLGGSHFHYHPMLGFVERKPWTEDAF